jgi:signal peptidase I
MSRLKKMLIAAAALVVLAVLIMGVWCLIYFRLVKVASGSMANTLLPGDHVLCLMLVGQIDRGDLVIYAHPQEPKTQYITRVIGLPGEKIQIRGKKVYINDQELAEARTFVDLEDRSGELKEISSEGEGQYRVYCANEEWGEGLHGQKFAVAQPYLIPADHCFILGDSRDNSLDSRYLGTVPRNLIAGRALMIISSDAPGGERRAFTMLK